MEKNSNEEVDILDENFLLGIEVEQEVINSFFEVFESEVLIKDEKDLISYINNLKTNKNGYFKNFEFEKSIDEDNISKMKYILEEAIEEDKELDSYYFERLLWELKRVENPERGFYDIKNFEDLKTYIEKYEHEFVLNLPSPLLFLKKIPIKEKEKMTNYLIEYAIKDYNKFFSKDEFHSLLADLSPIKYSELSRNYKKIKEVNKVEGDNLYKKIRTSEQLEHAIKEDRTLLFYKLDYDDISINEQKKMKVILKNFLEDLPVLYGNLEMWIKEVVPDSYRNYIDKYTDKQAEEYLDILKYVYYEDYTHLKKKNDYDEIDLVLFKKVIKQTIEFIKEDLGVRRTHE